MDENAKLYELGSRVWEYRRQSGFSKMLPKEMRQEAAQLCAGGTAAGVVAKAMGVSKASICEWVKKYAGPEPAAEFREVAVESEPSNFEVKLSGTVHGVRVELVGQDFSLLQRLMRKLG